MKYLLVFLTLVFSGGLNLKADDGAASKPAGGIIVFGRETRIVMAKEVLEISADKVIVDYEFRNYSDEDVTTVVAFPIPEYVLDDMDGPPPPRLAFSDFKLMVDGAVQPYKTEVRAFLKQKEVTALLNQYKINIATCDFDKKNYESYPCIEKLSADATNKLSKMGLLNGNAPNWSVRLKYYWTQTFPAHKIVKIRHEYTPLLGGTNSISYGMGGQPDPEMKKELESLCVEGKLKDVLSRLNDEKTVQVPYNYVDFILTTANTWKMPIEDFTLLVDRPYQKGALANYISFCWDGPVKKLDPDHFRAHLTNFVPKHELRIGFFVVEKWGN